MASFLVHALAVAFNVTGLMLTVYTLAPVFLAIGLLVAYVELF